MDQVGRVLSVKDGVATLNVKRISSCGTSCGSCSASCNIEGQNIEVDDTLNVSVGDYVEISTDSSKVLKYMFMLYGFSLLSLIGGFLISYYIFEKNNIENYEIYSFIVGILAFVISGFILRAIDKKSKIRSRDLNFMVKKL